MESFQQAIKSVKKLGGSWNQSMLKALQSSFEMFKRTHYTKLYSRGEIEQMEHELFLQKYALKALWEKKPEPTTPKESLKQKYAELAMDALRELVDNEGSWREWQASLGYLDLQAQKLKETSGEMPSTIKGFHNLITNIISYKTNLPIDLESRPDMNRNWFTLNSSKMLTRSLARGPRNIPMESTMNSSNTVSGGQITRKSKTRRNKRKEAKRAYRKTRRT